MYAECRFVWATSPRPLVISVSVLRDLTATTCASQYFTCTRKTQLPQPRASHHPTRHTTRRTTRSTPRVCAAGLASSSSSSVICGRKRRPYRPACGWLSASVCVCVWLWWSWVVSTHCVGAQHAFDAHGITARSRIADMVGRCRCDDCIRWNM